VSPHYDRNFAAPQESLQNVAVDVATDEEVVEEAAGALREVEVEAASVSSLPSPPAKEDDLNMMSIDELRQLAASLDVPNRAQVISRDELLAAIRIRR